MKPQSVVMGCMYLQLHDIHIIENCILRRYVGSDGFRLFIVISGTLPPTLQLCLPNAYVMGRGETRRVFLCKTDMVTCACQVQTAECGGRLNRAVNLVSIARTTISSPGNGHQVYWPISLYAGTPSSLSSLCNTLEDEVPVMSCSHLTKW